MNNKNKIIKKRWHCFLFEALTSLPQVSSQPCQAHHAHALPGPPSPREGQLSPPVPSAGTALAQPVLAHPAATAK